MIHEVRLDQIQPNPFYESGGFPWSERKVDALEESIRTTGFWGRLIGRAVETERGTVIQLAFGHHRLAALRRVYCPEKEVVVETTKKTDEQMLQMLVRENMEEWNSEFGHEMGTVRSVVLAFADGRMEAPEVAPEVPSSRRRYAPSFVKGGGDRQNSDGPPYTAPSIAKVLGWSKPSGQPQEKIKIALQALEMIELGLLKREDFDDRTRNQARKLIVRARKAESSNGESTVVDETPGEKDVDEDVQTGQEDVAKEEPLRIEEVFVRPLQEFRDELQRVVEAKGTLSTDEKSAAAKEFRRLAEWANGCARQLEQ